MTSPSPLWTRSFILICLAHVCMTIAFYANMPVLPLFLKDRLGAEGLVMGLVVAGLTIVALTVLSGAIIISYWDTPNRMLVTWLVAGGWLLLWVGVVVFLALTAKKAASPFALSRSVLSKDWVALKRRLK